MNSNNGHRYINFRSFLIIFVVIITAILCGYIGELNKIVGWLIFIGILIVFVILILISFAYLDKRFKIFSIILAAFLFLLTFLSFRITSENRISSDLNERGTYTMSGIVDDSYIRSDTMTFILKNISFNNVEYNGKLRVSVNMPEDNSIIYLIQTGDVMTVKASLYFLQLFNNGKINTYAYSSNIRYTCYPDLNDISFMPSKANTMTLFSENVEDILIDSMGAKIGGLAFAMLIGDKSNLTDETRYGFTISGLSHILAVSGLHIAFICAILYKIFEKLQMNRLVIFFVTMSFLIFYMFLCNLSTPVIRSTIMYAILLMSKLFFKRYDSLSSLSLACCVILLIFPFYLFDAGFILSAGAVYGMILFSKPFTNFFQKLRFPKVLAKAFATVTSVQFGILPAIFFFYAEIQTYSMLANLLLMPLIFITFTGVFVFIFFALLSSHFNFLLSIAGIGLSFIDSAAYAISLLPNATIIFPATGLIFLFYITSFFISRFYMAKHKVSPIKITAFLLSGLIAISGVFAIEKPQLNNVIIPINSYGKVTSIVIVDNKTYIVGDFPNSTELFNYMRLKFFNKIDAVLLNHLYEDEAEELARLMLKIKIEKIYIPYDADMSNGIKVFIEKKVNNLELVQKDQTICDGRFSPVYANKKTVGYTLITDNVKVLFTKRINYTATDFQATFDECAIVRCLTYSIEYPERFYLYELLLDYDSQYSLNSDYIFDFSNGNYYKKNF